MPTKNVVLSPYSAAFILPTLRLNNEVMNTLANIPYQLGLFYEEISIPSTLQGFIERLRAPQPYAPAKPFNIFERVNDFASLSYDDVKELLITFGEPQNSSGGEALFFAERAALSWAAQKKAHLYVLPGYREGYLKFCNKYQSEYFNSVKESFLCHGLLELVFEHELPSFDPRSTLDRVSKFAPFKADFQTGILGLSRRLSGSYFVSNEQRRFIKQEIAMEEQRLLQFLSLENLRRLDPDLASLVTDVVSSVIPVSVPLNSIVQFVSRIKRLRDFRKQKLDFILAVYMLKKLSTSQSMPCLPKCKMCLLSVAEIEGMTDEECGKVFFSRGFCLAHTIAFLDIRKRYGLTGRNLLLAVKKISEH
jgi:hypothetical protein